MDKELRRLRDRVSGLEHVEERFHEFASNVREVFSVHEGDMSRVIYVSSGYESVWGRSVESLYEDPASWMEAVHPEDLPAVREGIADMNRLSIEYRILRPAGDVRWIRARTFPVHDESGRVVRVIGFSQDTTDSKRLEQQLVQSQKMEAVGRLAGGIAHDFNNLLTVINGYSALLMAREDLPEAVRSDLASIAKAGARATALTSQLMLFSRKRTAELRAVDLNTAVSGIEPILRRLIREDVELHTVLDPIQSCVRMDLSQLEQVIMNLVLNARDAIQDRGTITIETGRTVLDEEAAKLHSNLPPGPYARLAVSDTGCGMSQQTQERIFEPFFTTKDLGQGTGLGLATVYGIVAQSGGTILVYSEQKVGTTFKIYLPVAEQEADGEVEAPESSAGTHTGTVLLVEDDEQVRAIARDVLRMSGFTVLECQHGGEALRVGEDYLLPIDLLVTDVIMPKMGGRELAEKLRLVHPELKVLYVSGYTENAIVNKGLLMPGMEHLAKPFSPAMLIKRVDDLMAQ